MKFLAILLSLYLTFLTALPCYDSDQCSNEQQIPLANSTSQTSGSHQDADLCPPFCVCSCCGQVVTELEITSFTFSPISKFENFNHPNRPQDLCDCTIAFWQPPKLA